jgi:hypothetical protein
MNLIFIGLLLFIIVITPLALGIKKSIEGYTDGFNYCHTDDADYNSPNSCYDISYNDSSGNKTSGKARIYGDYYITYNGYLNEVPDKTLYDPADNKIGYGPKGTNGITLCETGDPNYSNTNVCTVAKYYDLNKNVVTAPMRLSNRVYLDASGFVKQVPYGYIANAAKNGFNAIGYELNPILFIVSFFLTFKYRGKIKIYLKNFWNAELPEADGVFTFLLSRQMRKLDDKLEIYPYKPIKLVSFAFKIQKKQITKQKNGVFLYIYK